MTMNFARFLTGVFVIAAALYAADVFAWKVAPGKPVEVCEAVIKPRETLDVRLGPNGPEHVIPKPKCQMVQTGKAPTYYLDGDRFIPSQQTVPEGTPCVRTMKRDAFTYGLTEQGSRLWALCIP